MSYLTQIEEKKASVRQVRNFDEIQDLLSYLLVVDGDIPHNDYSSIKRSLRSKLNIDVTEEDIKQVYEAPFRHYQSTVDDDLIEEDFFPGY